MRRNLNNSIYALRSLGKDSVGGGGAESEAYLAIFVGNDGSNRFLYSLLSKEGQVLYRQSYR